jgi:hypothetical protein
MADKQTFNMVTFGPQGEGDRRNRVVDMLRNSPIPDNELMLNVGMYLNPVTLSRVLFMDFLYRQVLDLQGVVFDLGCRWGQNASLFTAMRGIYEPYNRLRKIVAFDTFTGFPSVAPEDGARVKAGDYGTPDGYESYLAELLDLQEAEAPLNHLKKYEIVKGDVTKTLPAYLERQPETVIALAYFDLDIYEPTRASLEAIKGRITKGTVLGFDEANDASMPGETIALREVLGLDRYALRRFRYNARTSYLIVE